MSTSNASATIFNNKTYDLMSYVARIVLPAAGALYFGLSQIWGFPNGEEVVGSLAVVGVFLGALLGFSDSQYKNSGARYDGSMEVIETEEDAKFQLKLDGDPYELPEQDEVIFKVVHTER